MQRNQKWRQLGVSVLQPSYRLIGEMSIVWPNCSAVWRFGRHSLKKYVFAFSILLISTLDAAAQNWTGGYTGAVGGYGSGHSDQTDPGLIQLPVVSIIPDDGHYSVKGGLFGGAL